VVGQPFFQPLDYATGPVRPPATLYTRITRKGEEKLKSPLDDLEL